MNIKFIFNKNNLVIGTLFLSIFFTFLFSLQLQKQPSLSTSSRAMELPNINIPPINVPPVQIGQLAVPKINISIAPLQIPPVNIAIPPVSNTQIKIPAMPSIPSTSGIPALGTYVSQGAAIIQQILANPNANQIIAMFLGSILSSPQTSSTSSPGDSNSPPPEQPAANPAVQPTSPPPKPQIVLQTCKEGDGTKTNTCPAIYYENGKLVSRQCGSTGWCFYTCYAPNNDRLDQVQCWQDQDLHCITPNCSCKDSLTNSRESCPNLTKRDGVYYLRGCDIKTNLGETKCLHTCFKLTNPSGGLDNEIVDCWPGQNKWETPPAAAVPTSSPGNQPAPTTAASAGKCHGKVPAVAAINRPASEWELPNNGESPCTCVDAPIVGRICAKISCSNCTSGVCECEDMPLSMPPVNLKCNNGGKAANTKCQP